MIWFKDNLSEDQLKKEYKALCKKYHPDVSKDPDAEEKMKEINAQFDQYWVNQKVREFEWVDTWKSYREARKVRATILCWLRKDKYNPGKFYSIVDEKHTWFWFWQSVIRIKGVTDDGPEWEGFKGGLAYCEYIPNDHNQAEEVELHKLPARISPATGRELYYFNRDHYGDSRFELFYEVSCRFGTFWARSTLERRDSGWTFYVKAELPEEFLKIGNSSVDEAKYTARSINRVYVSSKWIPEATCTEPITGADLPYKVFQDCTEEEFRRYHDVNSMGQYMQSVGVKRIRDSFWVDDNPIVSFCFRKGIIKLYESVRNFRVRCGYFEQDELKRNLHLLSIDDAEEVQDYLDRINEEFIAHFKQLVKSGRIKLKI